MPAVRVVRLSAGPARAVGELLSILYPPSGPAGTTDRYTLVYSSSLECDAAAEMARELDVPMAASAPAAALDDPRTAYAQAIGLIYTTPRGDVREKDRLAAAESGLVRIMQSSNEPRRRRWAAGMIAAYIRGDRLNDYDRAEEYLDAARQAAEPGSLERAEVQYALSRVYIHNGKPDLARDTLAQLIAPAGRFRGTEVLRRAEETRAELERKRRR